MQGKLLRRSYCFPLKVILGFFVQTFCFPSFHLLGYWSHLSASWQSSMEGMRIPTRTSQNPLHRTTLSTTPHQLLTVLLGILLLVGCSLDFRLPFQIPFLERNFHFQFLVFPFHSLPTGSSLSFTLAYLAYPGHPNLFCTCFPPVMFICFG